MRTILHIVTKSNDTLAAGVIAKQRTSTDLQVKLVDLTVTDPDYQTVLEEIFAADSVEVW
jgi:hypothetical protein